MVSFTMKQGALLPGKAGRPPTSALELVCHTPPPPHEFASLTSLPPESLPPSSHRHALVTVVLRRKDAFRTHLFQFLAHCFPHPHPPRDTKPPGRVSAASSSTSFPVFNLYGLIWLPTSAHHSSATAMVRVTPGSRGATPTACFPVLSFLDEAPDWPFLECSSLGSTSLALPPSFLGSDLGHHSNNFRCH